MDTLATTSGLVVRQIKEWGEILTPFETRNRYSVSDATTDAELGFAAEEAGSMIMRSLLKSWRPFRIAVLDKAGQTLLSIRRPFRFYFHEAEVRGTGDAPLGTIVRQFSVIRRIYSVLDPNGVEVCRLFGPLLRPWTFNVMVHGTESGQIRKKWGGLLKEGFTDADTFGVTFPPQFDARLRGLILGAVFLIDFVHFEDQGGG